MTEILILGVIFSIVYYECTDLSPGGIIVPGLMVLYVTQPLRMVYTLALALCVYFLIKLLSKRFLIFGKRRFALMILLGFLLNFLFNLIFGLFAGFNGSVMELIGYTVPGIIASAMYRQGAVKTTLSLGIVVGLLELCVLALTSMGVLL